MSGQAHVAVVDGSPTGAGRTQAVLDVVASAASDAGAVVERVALVGAMSGTLDAAVAAIAGSDAVVLGAPVYRAAAASPLKQLLDIVPRSNDELRESPLAGRAVAIVQTGASLHHFLALDGLRSVLAGFFAAHVLPPGLYVPREAFAGDGALLEPYLGQARMQGAALVELADILRGSFVLRSLRPQA